MNPFRIRLSALIVGAMFANVAAAADFLDIFRLAKRNDATFAASRASLEAGIEKLPQGRALLLPVINGSANTTGNDARNQTFNTDAQFNSNGWNVTLTQPVFRWQNLVQYQQSQFQVLQAEAQFAQATQDLIVRVGQAYFDVLAARDNIDFTRANKAAIAEQLAQAKRNFEVGTATITDTNEAQARYDLAVAQEIAGINALDVAERALQQIIGEPPQPLTPLRSNVQMQPPQPAVMDDWAKGARASNFTVRANEAVMEIADREVGRQRAGHYPTLDVVATSQENTNQSLAIGVGTRSTITQNSIGLQLNLPIFAGGAVNSRTREAVALKEKARQDLEASRRAAEFNARQSFLNVTNGIAQVRALEQALVSSETALQSNRVGYEVGVRINIDVLNAQQQVFQTKRDLSRARYDTILNGLKLKGAAGSLTEADVEDLNRLLGAETPAPSKPAASAPGDDSKTSEAPIVPGGLNLGVPGAGTAQAATASSAPAVQAGNPPSKAAAEKAAAASASRGKKKAGAQKETPPQSAATPALAAKTAPAQAETTAPTPVAAEATVPAPVAEEKTLPAPVAAEKALPAPAPIAETAETAEKPATEAAAAQPVAAPAVPAAEPLAPAPASLAPQNEAAPVAAEPVRAPEAVVAAPEAAPKTASEPAIEAPGIAPKTTPEPLVPVATPAAPADEIPALETVKLSPQRTAPAPAAPVATDAAKPTPVESPQAAPAVDAGAPAQKDTAASPAPAAAEPAPAKPRSTKRGKTTAKPIAAAEPAREDVDYYADRGIRVYQFVEPKVPGARTLAAAPQKVAEAAPSRDDEPAGDE